MEPAVQCLCPLAHHPQPASHQRLALVGQHSMAAAQGPVYRHGRTGPGVDCAVHYRTVRFPCATGVCRLAVDAGHAGPAHAGALPYIIADRALGHRVVPLSVVALYLDPELERHLRSGLRPDLAGGRNLYLADPVAGLCANLMAAQSQTGTAAGRHRSVAGSGSADSHLQRRIVGYPWHGVCGAGYRLAERQAAHPFAR